MDIKNLNIYELLKNSDYVIILDTNILLDFLRLPKSMRNDNFTLLENVKEYFFLPSTVKIEFDKQYKIVRKDFTAPIVAADNFIASILNDAVKKFIKIAQSFEKENLKHISMQIMDCVKRNIDFEYFPSKHNYLYFSSFSRYLSYFFNINYSDRSSRIIMSYANPVGYESDTAGVINSLFVPEAWCNWGYLGVIISPLIVGMIVQLIFIVFLKSKKTPIMLGLFSFISIRMSLTGGINDFFYNAGYMVIVLVFLLIFIFALGLKRYRRLMYENNFSSPTSIRQ